MKKRIKSAAVIGCVLWSAIAFFIAPFGHALHEIKARGPIFVGFLLVTEVLFVLGLAIVLASMGTSVMVSLRHPLELKARAKEILSRTNRSKTFWVGFYTNTAGAYGTGVVGLSGVLLLLPPRSWPIAIIFLFDIYATYVVRKWAKRGVRSSEG